MLYAVLLYTLTAILYALNAMYVRQTCGMWRLLCRFSAIYLASFSFACQSAYFIVRYNIYLHAKLFVCHRLGKSCQVTPACLSE